MSEGRKLLKQAAMQVGAGGSAGFVEVCIMHPLDLVKTRFQIQSKKISVPGDPNYYTGIADCMKKMYQNEGFFAFWKGVLPPILVETPKRAVKFFTFEQYKKLFLFGSSAPTPLTFSLAGLGAGVTEAILVNPFEVVKVSLQANRSHLKEVPSTWTVTKQIVSTQGIGFQGLNKGVTATIARNGVFNMIYFGFYHSMKGYLPEYKDPVQEFFRKVGIGFVSGTLASCVNIPFDVAKSRIQGPQPVAGEIKYRTTLSSMAIVYREEGWRALYKGLLPKVLRLGPGGAIMLVVYDYMYHYLTLRFPD
ncbi:mitochondrial 2-oxodicarboxylate carrier [Cryptotermes secundus]|uniref:mitochondrial 2-oxodicarboxylate carrier n=1 Tax=Cryptotermes secundus TaxID=105785 RepID=UPI000CD7D364|nr:mitochondrial 2-oxodicarboxylate carrier [Cryptotermes secundus]XP_023706271.1 mitochondrial 2-oxodicarboxylate carrier [Cryptotermes secundus]XP_023706272.1 mitochondrial 2-oxodicarboxylate carrier [Cryptotermes secundus]